MRKFALIAAVALAATLTLTACGKQDDADQQAATQTQKLTKPSSPTDSKAWNAYLAQILQNNLQGMEAPRPYPYLVPAGDSEEAQAGRDRQLSNVEDTVARGVLPGNLLAFAGPDSSQTADLLIEALKGAKPGSFKGVIVLFIGDQADQQRVEDAVKPTAATFRFVAM